MQLNQHVMYDYIKILKHLGNLFLYKIEICVLSVNFIVVFIPGYMAIENIYTMCNNI